VANLNVTEVKGFDVLNKKLKKLEDSVKRREVLGIQRKLAAPVRRAYAANLPKRTGNLSRSVAVRTIPRRKTGGNPAIAVVPGKRGRNDGFYKFMVIPKGTKTGSRKRGSRKGLNTVVGNARNKTLTQMENGLVESSEKAVQRYLQKKINRLSR
jgi:HK97 gp10 family phage protein